MNRHIAETIVSGILDFSDDNVLMAQLESMPNVQMVRIRFAGQKEQQQTQQQPTQQRPFNCKVEGQIEQKCSICLTEFTVGQKMVALPCQPNNLPHRFHAACLEPWFIRHRNCPVCRKQY